MHKLATSPKIVSLRKTIEAKFLSKNGILIFVYNSPERLEIINLICKIRTEVEMALGINEAYQIFMAVKSAAKIKGDIAEVGVYQGASAKIICEAKGEKTLHLFDTFEGLPEVTETDRTVNFKKGDFHYPFERVKAYLSAYSNVHIYKGLFPKTADGIKNERFSFVNLDVDIYESTLNSLIFFYPRMNQGGILISHDYSSLPGVKKAFDEFFKDKPEPIIELSGSQCLVIKSTNGK